MTAVLIDAVQLSGESAQSGIGTYVRELLQGLTGIPDLEVRALATADADLPAGTQRQAIRRIFRQGRPAVLEHEVRRTIEMRGARAGVFHNPNPHAPRLPRRPYVQTLHDVIPLVVADPALEGLRRRFERFGPRYASADAVIAVSRFAADQGIERLGIDPGRITVIHHGVSGRFTPGVPTPDGADPPYISVVSEYSRRKGFGAAFEVAARLADAGLPHRLKVAGRIPDWQRADFDAELAGARRPERIDVLGFVPDLVPLYRGATAHFVCSRHEGFGLPALEAMACAVPVVAFANTAVAEVVGDAGILVPDGDVAAAASALESVLRSPGRREELSGAALERSRLFTWERSARLHAEVYRAVAR